MPFDALIPLHRAPLVLLDQLLDGFHLALVLFLLIGWAIRPIRRLHRFVLALVWFSWLALGLYVHHLGYCIITDWQWAVKARLGVIYLPPSYVEYLYQQAGGGEVDNALISWITGSTLAVVTLITTLIYYKQRAGRASLCPHGVRSDRQ